MKIVSIIIITLLVVAYFIYNKENSSNYPQSVMNIIENGDEIQKSQLLSRVLINNESYDALSLLLTSKLAFERDRKEDATFLFNASQIRISADIKVFEPKGEGGSSPLNLLGALSSVFASKINVESMMNHHKYPALITRLKNWNPSYGGDYNPGWAYKNTPNLEQAKTTITQIKNERIGSISELALLFDDKTYFEAFLVYKNRFKNFITNKDNQEFKAKIRKAEETMLNIEKSKNVKGVMLRSKKN